jgi:DNA repair exonuclease SbcCD ATPase subunit
MRIRKLYIRSFKGFGPDPITIEFDNSSELSVVIGLNGSGKTSISHAILFGLYGKNPDGNITDLPNRFHPNKMKVVLDIEVRGSHIKIERTISNLKVLINGSEWEQAGKAKMQTILENEYYDLPYYAFKNILILSINDFSSYLSMSPSDKRKIFDRVFGFSILNDMRRLNKLKLNEIENQVSNYQAKISQLEKNIDESEKHVDEFLKISKEENLSKIDSIKSFLKNSKKNFEKQDTELKNINKLEEEIQEQISIYRNKIYEEKSKIKSVEKQQKLYQNDKCPTCHSDLTTKFHKNVEKELSDKKEYKLKLLTEFFEKIESIESQKKEIQSQKKNIQEQISNINSEIYSFTRELKKLSDVKNQDLKIDNLKKLIDNFRIEKRTIQTEEQKKSKKEKFFKVVDSILSEDGIKKIALKTIIPKLNAHIKNETKNMHLKYGVEFDEHFNAKITHFNQEISYRSLSTGERKKFDFVILISILKIIKSKYSSFNILFLDEIFSSVDSDGRYSILKILKDFTDEYYMKAFVINHAELPSQFFRRKFNLKNEQYSELEIDEV